MWTTPDTQIALVFFVENKNSRKKIVQDYRYLNKWTIKNNYPLPLISDIVEVQRRYLDLWWEYKNIWIKEGNEWKTAFITLKGLFEPTILFFGLTNSPATFQTMTLWKLINTGEVASFIDNVIVKVEEKEKHNEVV